jgi:hypothetical protein
VYWSLLRLLVDTQLKVLGHDCKRLRFPACQRRRTAR